MSLVQISFYLSPFRGSELLRWGQTRQQLDSSALDGSAHINNYVAITGRNASLGSFNRLRLVNSRLLSA
jgi:hypothetical protein